MRYLLVSRIYNFSGRIASILSHPFVRPILNHSQRCRILVIRQNKILLVKGWLGSQRWSLPGGGIKKKESALQAGSRELAEETGLVIPASRFKIIGTSPYPDFHRGLKFSVNYLLVSLESEDSPAKKRHYLEIIDAKWFDLDKLPKDISPVVKAGLKHRAKNHKR
jgi:ADP-ribose pyrophosphatase YjhB (NUDIX family)